jgi:SAM-dependent methyltransferase
VPVFCNALLPTASEARAAPTGDIELAWSPTSGYLWNRAFDPALVAYDPAYENSLHHSPRFQAFARHVAERLVARYDLRGRRIVEIGPGEGNFLALLCELGANEGVGYDAAYDPARHKVVTSERMRIIPAYYPFDRPVDGDLVVCQHVLEHLADPAALVEGVRRSIPDGRATAVYFEVPDATYMVEQLAVWDLIYEHRSYFAAPTLEALFLRAGFEVTEVDRAFGDQYLYLEARAGDGRSAEGADAVPDPAALAKLGELVAAFGDQVRRVVTTWSERLAQWVGAGPVAVWGAGSKGVTFLNLVEAGADVAYVVDVNPNKAGLHVPGTGQAVVDPAALAGRPLETVVVMNPLYVDEIRATLAELGSRADVVAVTD